MVVRSSPLAALLTVLLLAVACVPAGPTGSPSAGTSRTAEPSASQPAGSGTSQASGAPGASATVDPAAVYRAIESQVTAIRGLAQLRPVEPKTLDDAAMRAYIETEFAKENPADRLAADERLLKMLGLLPAASSLATLQRELLTSQVIGLYSPDDRQLYVLAKPGDMGPAERMVFAHEFTHALQDQHFDLNSLGIDDPNQGDRALARLGLVEGDATTVMLVWAQRTLTMTELLKVVETAADPAAAAILARLPPILRDGSMFPYETGAGFIVSLQSSGGWPAVDRAFGAPPDSTEQVMHASKYAAREAPISVAIPPELAGRMGPGWTVGAQDTLGEFRLSLWLRGAAGLVTSGAATAAAGWGGDRLVLLDGPGGARGVALLTAWDRGQDAVEFAAAANAAIQSYGLNAIVVHQPGASTVSVLIGSDDATTGQLHRLLGATGV